MTTLICGLDFETTGLDPRIDRITEIGAVLWEWETATPLVLMSDLVKPGRSLPPEIVKLTGITDEMLDEYGKIEEQAIAGLHFLMRRATYAMAHNGTTFDSLFYIEACKRCQMEAVQVSWLDSKTDIRYPEAITTRNLRHLASEHNFLNPFAHRAVFDVLTMLKVAGQYSLEDIVARSKEPIVYLRALVSFDDKEKAKARGYYWCGPQKIWWKALKESDAILEVKECGFPTATLLKAPEESHA